MCWISHFLGGAHPCVCKSIDTPVNVKTQISFQLRGFIHDTQIEDKERKTPIDFEVYRSKVIAANVISDKVHFLVVIVMLGSPVLPVYIRYLKYC